MPIAKAIAAETRLLCFDEFQVTNIADAMILGRLFETLFEEGLTVIATSNRAPDDLYRNGLQRDRFLPFIELVKQRLEILELGGGHDYRMDRMRELDMYLTPLGAWATNKLDETFRALTNGADGEPRILRTQGRDVDVPRAQSLASLAPPEPVEHPQSVGRQRHPGADLGQLPRLLVDLDVDPGPGQRDRRRHPADPAADHHRPQRHGFALLVYGPATSSNPLKRAGRR